MQHTLRTSLLALCFALLPACAGSDSVGEGDVGDCGDPCGEETNPLDALPLTTLISEFNKNELVAFCEQRKAFHTRFLELQTDPSLNCTALGLDLRFQEEADIPACEEARDACIQEALLEERPSFNLLECLPFQVSSTDMLECTISLGEFNACSEALLIQAQTLIETLNCSITMEEAAVFQAQNNANLPPECESISTECPPINAELIESAE